jgi:hypothetical protein
MRVAAEWHGRIARRHPESACDCTTSRTGKTSVNDVRYISFRKRVWLLFIARVQMIFYNNL